MEVQRGGTGFAAHDKDLQVGYLMQVLLPCYSWTHACEARQGPAGGLVWDWGIGCRCCCRVAVGHTRVKRDKDLQVGGRPSAHARLIGFANRVVCRRRLRGQPQARSASRAASALLHPCFPAVLLTLQTNPADESCPELCMLATPSLRRHVSTPATSPILPQAKKRFLLGPGSGLADRRGQTAGPTSKFGLK